MFKLMFFAASLSIFSAMSHAQTIYSWRDGNGVMNFSDTLSTKSQFTIFAPTTKPPLRDSLIQPITSIPIGAASGGTSTAIDVPLTTGGAVVPIGTATGSSGVTSPLPSNLPISFFYTFTIPTRSEPGTGVSDDGIWWVERKEGEGRVTVVNGGRDGPTALRLHTEPGDNNVEGSGVHERASLALPQAKSDCYQGREQWWENSTLFPDDFVYPPSGWHVVVEFHGTSVGTQGNLQVFANGGNLLIRGHGGVAGSGPKFAATAGAITKNQWYDFVYHVKWSSGSDGFAKVWVNGAQYVNYTGPTLYEGQGCFFKLQNYHTAFGQPTSIIFDRVIRRDVAR